MATSKVYIFKGPEGMWTVGTIRMLGDEEIFFNHHETSTWVEAFAWVEANYDA